MNDSVRAGLSPAPEVFGGQWALADVVARLRVARMSWRKRQGRGREPGGREPAGDGPVASGGVDASAPGRARERVR